MTWPIDCRLTETPLGVPAAALKPLRARTWARNRVYSWIMAWRPHRPFPLSLSTAARRKTGL